MVQVVGGPWPLHMRPWHSGAQAPLWLEVVRPKTPKRGQGPCWKYAPATRAHCEAAWRMMMGRTRTSESQNRVRSWRRWGTIDKRLSNTYVALRVSAVPVWLVSCIAVPVKVVVLPSFYLVQGLCTVGAKVAVRHGRALMAALA